MTKVIVKRNGILKLQGCLLVGEIDKDLQPLPGIGESIWKHAQLTKEDFLGLQELQDGEVRVTGAGQLSATAKQKEPGGKKKNDDGEGTYTGILHIVLPSLDVMTTDERNTTLRQLYFAILEKAVAMTAKSIVVPFLGIQSLGVPIQDGIDAAINSIHDFLEANNYKGMSVEEISLFTTNGDVSTQATKHPKYKSPIMRGKIKQETKDDSRFWTCIVSRLRDSKTHGEQAVADSACGGLMHSLSTMAYTISTDIVPEEVTKAKFFGASHEADLIMSRIGEFNTDWSSPAAHKLEICTNHLDRLSRDWENAYYKNVKYRDHKQICSFPDHHGTTRGAPRPLLKRGNADKIEKIDAIRWMKIKHTVIQIGAAICEADKAFLQSSEFDENAASQETREFETRMELQEWNDFDSLADQMEKIPGIPQKTPSTASFEVKEQVGKLLDILKCKEWRRRRDWNRMEARQRCKKVAIVRTALDAICEVLTPDAKNDLKECATNSNKVQDNARMMPLKQLLAKTADLYERTDSKTNRLFILASVSFLKRDMLLPFFPDLSNYMYKKAKRVICNPTVQDVRILRERYDRNKVDRLLGFLLSPLVVLNLPFDERCEKMNDGSTLHLPNYMRLQTIDEVYNMYKAYLIEEGEEELLLKETTAKFIIKLVAPTRRKNLTCCDEKVAAGMQAYDDMFAMVNELEKKGFIIKDNSLQMIRDLQRSKSYLRGDFKVHIQKYSSCADHCASFALSDPKQKKLEIDCSTAGEHAHQHDSLCDRCEMVNTSMDVLEDALVHAVNATDDVLEREHFNSRCEELEVCRGAILEMKKHQVRAAVSHGERADHIEALEEGEAFVTLDWAQKLEALLARERQSDYYAKSGISYHISHAVTIINGQYAEHTSVHIVGPGVPQDGCAVSLIVESFLLELKAKGIKSVILRSDCAGCYRNGSLMRSLIDMQKKIGIEIKGYLFSEAQAGKSACDRGSACVKRKCRDVVASKRTKIDTKESFYDALTKGKLLNGFSIHLCELSEVQDPPRSKIDKITSFSSFVFESSAIRLRKHRSIGEGIIFDFKKLHPCEGKMEITGSGGYTVDDGDKFWMTRAVKEEKAIPTEPIPDSLAPEAPTRLSTSRMLPCPEENCEKEFISFRELEKHLLRGKHTLKKERKTLHDYCTTNIASSLDTHFAIAAAQLGSETRDAFHSSVHNGVSKLQEGWALRTIQPRNPDDEEAREIIKNYFKKRIDAGEKCNPHEAELHMKTMKKPGSGSLLIRPKNRLSISQIKSVINGLLKKMHDDAQETVAKRRKVVEVKNKEDEEEEEGEDTDDEIDLVELNDLVKDAFKANHEDGEHMEVDEDMNVVSNLDLLRKQRRRSK